MSIALATRGVIGGFMGVGGDVVYVDVPVCGVDTDADEFGTITLRAKDMTEDAGTNITRGMEADPRRIDAAEILPTKNDLFPPPRNL